MTPSNRTIIVRGDDTPLRVAKGASEVWTLHLDWSRQLPADTVTTSTWTQPAGGLTLGTSAISSTGKRTSVVVSGGDAGSYATLTDTVTTSAGETLSASLIVEVDRD